jgi:hypothetical protein
MFLISDPEAKPEKPTQGKTALRENESYVMDSRKSRTQASFTAQQVTRSSAATASRSIEKPVIAAGAVSVLRAFPIGAFLPNVPGHFPRKPGAVSGPEWRKKSARHLKTKDRDALSNREIAGATIAAK